jgi:Ca2+:H+ antiporter
VSALRHQQQARRVRSGQLGEEEDPDGHAGHDGPSWSRAVSASVLLACTALYAIIAGT